MPPGGQASIGEGMNDAEILSQSLDALGLPTDAKAWLLDVWAVIQALDDLADGADANPAAALDAATAIFVRMPLNPFWLERGPALIPVLSLQITKWAAANEAETGGWADERSYVWRAGFYDLVAAVCQHCGLPEAAKSALYLYGETFASYREEFPCPTPR